MISQSRWEHLLQEVEGCLKDNRDDYSISRSEIDVLMSVLKNNTPFQVVPDCVSDTVLETNDVLIETKHFKVLGNEND